MAIEDKGRLERLLDEWETDAVVDPLELGDSSLAGARLHAKWLRYRAIENLKLARLLEEGKALRLAKHEFYTQGPTAETRAQGWEFPAVGMVLKGDVPLYMGADRQMVDHNLRVAYQREVCDTIGFVLEGIKARGFDINRKLEDVKIKLGRG